MKKLHKLFTLIELIVVIVVLGVLAAIIIPNVANMKNEAIVSSVNANIRNIQTSTDVYSLKNNGKIASILKPKINSPEYINFDEIYPDYLRDKPEDEKLPKQYYWLDSYGKVWGSTVNNPSNIIESSEGLEWSKQEKATSYNIYELAKGTTSSLKDSKLKKVATINPTDKIDKIQLKKDNPSVNYLISAVDEYGLETAPTGLNSNKIEDWFTPIVGKVGSFNYSIRSDELMYWINYSVSEDKPEGTNIKYEFSVEDRNGDFTEWTEDFKSLPPSREIKIKVTTMGFGNKLPSLYSLRVNYYFAKEEVISNISRTAQNLTPEGKPIREEDPTFVVDMFTLPTNLKIKEIYSGDSYNPLYVEPTIRYSYKEPNATVDQWQPVTFLTSVPSGSTVKMEREYPSSQGLQVQNPIVKVADKVNIQTEDVKEISNVAEWTTVQTFSFIASTDDGQLAKWTKLEVSDTKPDNTQILYTFRANGSSEVDDLSELPASRTVTLIARLQKKTANIDSTENPSIESIRLYNERGYADLSLVKPTVSIVPAKSNNKNSNFFSPETIVTWDYESVDPRNKKITKVEWAGDKRSQYPIGKYTVQARVLNESNYWSDWTSYTFEVKAEQPVAVISMTPETNLRVNYPITWSAANSYDPDGDGLSEVEWEGKESKYTSEGTKTVRMRVKDNEGNWSEWTSKTFSIAANSGLGRILLEPESGYTRYDDKDSKIALSGNSWVRHTEEGFYNSTETFTNSTGAQIKILFKGTGFMIIDNYHQNRATSIEVDVDGSKSTYSAYTSNTQTVKQQVLYEKTNLNDGVHEVVLTLKSSGYLTLDAIDIQGQLLEYKVGTGSVPDVEGTNLVPPMSAMTSAVGNVLSSSNYGGEWQTYYAFDGKRNGGASATGLINGVNGGYIGYEFNESKIVNGYRINAGNGDRYTLAAIPRSWDFQGYDGANWVTLDRQLDQKTWSANETRTYLFANNQKYKAYRLLVISSQSNPYVYSGAGELELFQQGLVIEKTNPNGSLIYPVSGFTSDQGTVLYSTDYGSTWSTWKAFDGVRNAGSGATGLVREATNGYIGFQFKTPKVVTKYVINAGSGANYSLGALPKTWEFQAYNGSSWVTLDRQENQPTWAASTDRAFTISNANSYIAYRILIISNHGAGYSGVGELDLY